MSISSMTNVAINRRTGATFAPDSPADPNSVRHVAAATGDSPSTQSDATAALKSIATYIPTEVLTLYVAAVGALTGPATAATTTSATSTDGTAQMSALLLLAIFTLLTPVVVWLVYAAKVRNSGDPLPATPRTWPIWEMSAATIAFAAWAFAFPQNPFSMDGWYSSAIAGLVVVATSIALGLVAPVVSQPLPRS